MVTFHDPVQNIELSYHIDGNILPKWDRVRKVLIKEDSDRIYLVDGRERTGKSLFTFQQAKYLDRSFCLDRVCFTPEEFLRALRTAKPGQAIVFDEAFRGLSSKASQSKVNKAIVQALMEVGQKNLIVFIVLPTFFLLEIYAAVLRSNCLFHVYKAKNGNRKFRIYNYSQKSILWNVGKKKGFSYAWPRVKIRGTFFNKWAIDEQSYRKKKAESFGSLEINQIESEKVDKSHALSMAFGINYYQMKKLKPRLTKAQFFRDYFDGGGQISAQVIYDSILKYEKELEKKGIDIKKVYTNPKLLDLKLLNARKRVEEIKEINNFTEIIPLKSKLDVVSDKNKQISNVD